MKNTSEYFIRRLFLFGINAIFNRSYFFKILGFFNRQLKFLGTIFIAYPASEDYALAYSFKKYRQAIKWRPYLIGLLCQDKKWGLMFAVSSTEKDYLNPDNKINLIKLVDYSEHIRQLVECHQKTFAGILPGVLLSKRIIRASVETDVTVQAILKAVKQIITNEKYDNNVPVIVLGGKGFIGRRLLRKFEDRDVYCVDVGNTYEKRNSWPYHLSNKKAVLINVTKKAVLEEYFDRFWPELIIVNEVYPEPSVKEISVLAQIGCPTYHIVGIKGKAYPNFPKAYNGGIPCCAGQLLENIEAVVKKLN